AAAAGRRRRHSRPQGRLMNNGLRGGLVPQLLAGIPAVLLCCGLAAALDEYAQLNPTAGQPRVRITLQNSFLVKYRDRVTIDTTLTVDKVGPVQMPAQGGSLRLAGRDPEVGLPVVAHILTAASQRQLVDQPQRLQG